MLFLIRFSLCTLFLFLHNNWLWANLTESVCESPKQRTSRSSGKSRGTRFTAPPTQSNSPLYLLDKAVYSSSATMTELDHFLLLSRFLIKNSNELASLLQDHAATGRRQVEGESNVMIDTFIVKYLQKIAAFSENIRLSKQWRTSWTAIITNALAAILTEYPVSFEALTNRNETALHIAATIKIPALHAAITTTLLENGAAIDINESLTGDTPFERALKTGISPDTAYLHLSVYDPNEEKARSEKIMQLILPNFKRWINETKTDPTTANMIAHVLLKLKEYAILTEATLKTQHWLDKGKTINDYIGTLNDRQLQKIIYSALSF